MRLINACSKTIAFFFVLGFILSAILALFLFNTQIWFTRPETYKAALVEQEVYAKLPALLANQFATQMAYDPCREDPGNGFLDLTPPLHLYCMGSGLFHDPNGRCQGLLGISLVGSKGQVTDDQGPLYSTHHR